MIKFGKGNLRIPKLERPVYVVAGGMTDFRKAYPEKQSTELCMDAIRMAVLENDLRVDLAEFKSMVNFCVYSQFADHFGDQLLAAAKIHDYLGFDPVGNVEVKTGGATGGSAVLTAAAFVASGYASVVPVIGWEKMDEVSTRQANSYIAFAACKDFESFLGLLYASYYDLMNNRYDHTYKPSRETLAKVAQKNHRYALSSPFSHLAKEYTTEEILASKIVSGMLTFPECCAMSVGSACLILADEENAFKLSDNPILIKGIGSGTHTLRTADRRDMEVLLLPNESPDLYKDRTEEWPGFTGFLAARFAAHLAYHSAGITNPLEELDVLETHDAFTISDLQTYEDVGLRPYGHGAEFIESGDAYYGGKLSANLSGGLLGTMHSVGATGIFQIAEILWQLQGKWAKFHEDEKIWQRFGKTKPANFKNLQVPNAKKGMAISHAGTGSHVTCAILSREDKP